MQKINQKQKQLIKIFVSLFIVSSIIINWNNVSWLFNYRVMNSLVYSFFNPYENSELLVSANNMVINTNTVKPETTLGEPMIYKESKVYPYSAKNNSIEIPSINISAPIVMSQSTDAKVLTKNLDSGVVYYPNSVLPGESGQIVVLGHSAPPNWPKIKYDWVFSEINNLNMGDQIIIHFGNKKYIYNVVEKNIIQVGQDVESNKLDGQNNILTLISCWPPGKNYQRIAVQAELLID
ncbi:MAG: hypothetical protein A3D34_00515 [Candidatus Staskawiczbacteria bacterium RIFCSPHIGHO2_02_FULL_33_16]|uniref:Sortase n=1 Tax=Candidatus Staskawiczbacteria bacterium RIFCSPHIGHO2_02_FULL_33_16 TaxID=1802204 RepID=A0A1G2HW38_9BACT|nr:MAG: hypothetical protein A3D34_00515 [Candidatus Staskawiczbacteria bacterium RIFCSPHIGHO2_02_FULL_33_16]OGZ70353.1 MAG: hypothetical protein A2980_01820 [Candidatus Staskawiczbacteria bacterium RIFCSPLOWO2_01_FULL_33_13]